MPQIYFQPKIWVIFYFSDIDECKENPNVCGAGECVNTLGSFHCRCEEGYSVKPDGGPQCTDEDECYLGTFICDENADCINNPVSKGIDYNLEFMFMCCIIKIYFLFHLVNRGWA